MDGCAIRPSWDSARTSLPPPSCGSFRSASSRLRRRNRARRERSPTGQPTGAGEPHLPALAGPLRRPAGGPRPERAGGVRSGATAPRLARHVARRDLLVPERPLLSRDARLHAGLPASALGPGGCTSSRPPTVWSCPTPPCVSIASAASPRSTFLSYRVAATRIAEQSALRSPIVVGTPCLSRGMSLAR